MTHIFPLTPRVKAQLEGRYGTLKCERCGRPLEENEEVVSHNTTCRRKYYCPACWNQMFIEVEA